MRSQLYSSGLKITSVTSDGVELNANTESNINICTAVTNFIHDTSLRYDKNTARSASNENPSIFSNGGSLFYATALYLGKTLRANQPDFNYGVVPMPKYDDSSDYISTTYGASVFAIPLDVKDAHVSAVILDAMNALSNDTVVYNFYDILMKSQIADAQDDANMIDFARSHIYVDFEFINEMGLLSAFQNAVINNIAVSSSLSALTKAAQKKLEKLLEKYN